MGGRKGAPRWEFWIGAQEFGVLNPYLNVDLVLMSESNEKIELGAELFM